MKLMNWMMSALAVTVLLSAGCSKKSSVDTAPLEKSFATAEPSDKASANKAVSDIKSGNYSGAMAELQKLGAQAKLTPEQKQAVKDVVAQVQQQLADAVKQVGQEADKAGRDLQKSLPKP